MLAPKSWQKWLHSFLVRGGGEEDAEPGLVVDGATGGVGPGHQHHNVTTPRRKCVYIVQVCSSFFFYEGFKCEIAQVC